MAYYDNVDYTLAAFQQSEEENKEQETIRAIIDEWLAGIAHRIITSAPEERKVWEDCLNISGKFYNRIRKILDKN